VADLISAGVVLKHFIAKEFLATIDVALEGDRFVKLDIRRVEG